MENLWPGCADIPGPAGGDFIGHNDYNSPSPLKESHWVESQEEAPIPSERNHDEVWEEEIELPERKESKQIPNPWE